MHFKVSNGRNVEVCDEVSIRKDVDCQKVVSTFLDTGRFDSYISLEATNILVDSSSWRCFCRGESGSS